MNNEVKTFNKEFYIFKKVNLIDKFNFYEYLATMLDGWVTIVQALQSVQDKMKNWYFKSKINELLIYVGSWDNLHKAMKKMPDIFSLQESSIVEAWEQSWTLVESLSSLALEFKKLHNLKLTIKSALTYPIIIILFLILAILVVLTYVIPSIMPLIEESWREKPFATVALIATSNFVINNFFWILIFLAIIVFFIFVYKNTENWRKNFDNFLLSFPLIWNVYKNYILASSASVFWNLMNSWIPVIKSLNIVWKATNNSLYEEKFKEISVHVSKGHKLVDSIMKVDEEWFFFPSDFIQLLSVWEKTASIWKICKKLNEQYTREVNYSIAVLTKWIEPIAILIAWLFVLWFAFAIFWAILKLTQTIG